MRQGGHGIIHDFLVFFEQLDGSKHHILAFGGQFDEIGHEAFRQDFGIVQGFGLVIRFNHHVEWFEHNGV